MAKMTTLQKINKTVADMSGTTQELKELDSVIVAIAGMELKNVEDRLFAARKRAAEDYEYLSNKIRGYVAREANLDKLIEVARQLFS